MPRKHTLVVALSLAFAAVVGTIALTKTVHLGQASAKPVSQTIVAKRTTQLDRFEASLRAALKRTPPAVPKKLPPIPAVATPAASAAPSVAAAPAPAAVPAASQRVVYVRPAPIIIHKHRAGGEHESEGSDHGDGAGSGLNGGGGVND
jgi:hypothetical protein